jgi:hypothetical protein
VTARFPAASSDHRHMLPIAADGLAALAAGVSRFVRIEFVRGALCMRRFPTLARDLALLAAIHRRETTVASPTATALHVTVRRDRCVTLLAVDRFVNAIVVAWSVRHPAPPKSL